ncbi:hypothetical protein Val02_53430 [Virgisporangium aliadipatigenens]|uniref:Uncharacterized protein n=1 Tax=Virgisporangium aliadipatigenens TaxID=741659 RepID=A0A8J3YQ74_9ACTN|nr:hypothetical protein [Virgisporangium aliadipatigenens]GIJ48457.1 hypothetical protein Val02_53430 [Virgisporangium aliadipatigenens]
MAGTLSRYAVEAAELEAAAASSGSDAPQLLVEAAHQWRLAGDSERSQGLLGTVIAGGGEMGCYARAELAGLLFDAGARDAAFAELALLADDPQCGDGPSRVVAELLTDQGALTAAVPWYDRVVTTGDPILEVNRSRVRKRLGLADPE